MTIAAGDLAASRQLRAQIWNHKQKAEKPTPSDVLLPAKPPSNPPQVAIN